MLGRRVALDDGVVGIPLQSRHEEHLRGRQLREPGEVDVALVDDHNGARQKLLLPRHRSLAVLAVCDHQEGRQIPVVIECEMQLDRTFGAAKRRPRKHLRAQVDDRRIETEQFVFEPERLRARDLPTPRQDLIEHGLIERPRPVGIGVRQRGPVRSRRAQMRQLALATRQAAADLAQRMGAPELREQHRDELVPAGESACVPLRPRVDHGFLKLGARKKLE